MATHEDILTRLEKLEKENETLSKRIEALEKGKSTTKKTPKTKSNPIGVEEYVKNMQSGFLTCSYYPKTGANKLKFCNGTKDLMFDGKPIPDNMGELSWEQYRLVRCKCCVKLARDPNIDLGFQELTKHYGKINDNTVIAKSEEEPAAQLSQILTGNTVDVITTPSKAMASNKKKINDDYIEQGDFLDEAVKHDDSTVIIRYHKSKTGTPKKRPSPVILGVCDEEFDRDNYLNTLKAPSDKIKASVNLKYEPLESETDQEENNVQQEVKSMPQVKTEDDISAGLTVPPPEEDAYKAETDGEEDDEDITALLDDLKK